MRDLEGADPLAIAAAVRAAGERLRKREVTDPEEIVALVEKLEALAAHESARVRQAIAEVSPWLPSPVYASIAAKLAADRSAYVREAAADAERRLATVRRDAAREDERDRRVEGWYAQLEKHKGARRVAERIAAHEVEYYVRRMMHEIAPLRGSLDAEIRALREAVASPEIERSAIRAHADRIEELDAKQRHVLDDASRHARTIEPDFRPERLRAIVDAEAALLPSRFPDRAARLRVESVEIDPSLVVEIDRAHVAEAFANILKNAVEAYAVDAASIVVRVRAVVQGGQVHVSFADEGCGMTDDARAKAFVPFGSSKPQGTGFGLFLARKVARQLHGGDLAIESARGEGTTVTMTLPLRQETGRKKR